MKRLIRKAEDDINQTQDMQPDQNSEVGNSTVDNDMMQRLRDEVRNDIDNKNDTNMVMLNELDEADVRHDKCPQCKTQPISRKEGFKVCPSCGMIYKILDGKGYAIIG